MTLPRNVDSFNRSRLEAVNSYLKRVAGFGKVFDDLGQVMDHVNHDVTPGPGKPFCEVAVPC